MQRSINNQFGIRSLWFNWLLGSGALTLLIVMSLWVPPKTLPFVAYGLQIILFILIRRNRESARPICFLFPFMVTRILFWSGTVMLILNLFYSYGVIHYLFSPDEINTNIPFISVLIVSPISMAISGWGKIAKRNISFCKDCSMRFGTPAERGFLGNIYTQEGQYQLVLLFLLSTGCTVVGWTYYALMYINSYFSVPDRFIFIGIPFLLWIASAIYMGLRYLGLWGYYCENVAIASRRQSYSTLLRFIMVYNDSICLREPNLDPSVNIITNSKYDIPISTYLNLRESMSQEQGLQFFLSLTQFDSCDLRFLYSTGVGNADCNIFHFVCFINDTQKKSFDTANPNCEWFRFRQIADMINNHCINPLFSAEIVRIHTIALAYKTYTLDGKRRYKIKGYRPSFNINELKDMDVDFNDTRWLYVADNNEDTPFYKMRLFWREYINGIGEFNNKKQ